MTDKSAENMTIDDLWHQLTRLNDWLREHMPDASVVTEGDTATATLWALDKLVADNERLIEVLEERDAARTEVSEWAAEVERLGALLCDWNVAQFVKDVTPLLERQGERP